MALTTTLATGVGFILVLSLYIWHNDRRILRVPPEIQALKLRPISQLEILAEKEASKGGLVQLKELEAQMPPKTGRRYIVVGGGGSVGGWVAVHLLQRGENPKSIRVIDLSPVPTNIDVQTAQSQGLEYLIADMSNTTSLNAAFTGPWSDGLPSSTPTTVFHTAANIRFFERQPLFLSRSTTAIVNGTTNILTASVLINADILIYTSSIGVYYKYVNMLLWPWQKVPKEMYQEIRDDEELRPKTHAEHYSNYNIAKGIADDLVRKWDNTPLPNGKTLRTGCLRPGNTLYGPRGGTQPASTETNFRRKENPMWQLPITHSWMYSENCSLAHLLYEKVLLDFKANAVSSKPKALPDIAGQSFVIADPGPPRAYSEYTTALETLAGGANTYPSVSPTLFILISHLVETYYTWQFRVTQALPVLGAVLRPVPFPFAYIQPPMFCGNVNLIIDDSRARLRPEEGGLGYKGAWTSVEGWRRTWQDYAARNAVEDKED